jgi:hypothetical protein
MFSGTKGKEINRLVSAMEQQYVYKCYLNERHASEVKHL